MLSRKRLNSYRNHGEHYDGKKDGKKNVHNKEKSNEKQMKNTQLILGKNSFEKRPLKP